MARNRPQGRQQPKMNRGNRNTNLSTAKQRNQVKSQQFKLKRYANNRNNVEKNLVHLQKNLQKKQMAQAMYYNQGRSPLIKQEPQSSNPSSIHSRLGNKRPFKNNQQNSRTSLKNNNRNFNNGIVTKRNRQNPRNTMQPRLQRIRQNLPSAQVNNQQPRFPRQKLQLKRNTNRQNIPFKPTNMTIKVETKNDLANDAWGLAKHSVSSQLNPRLQAEIRMIQSQSNVREIIPPVPIHPQGAGVTKRTLNERFSQF